MAKITFLTGKILEIGNERVWRMLNDKRPTDKQRDFLDTVDFIKYQGLKNCIHRYTEKRKEQGLTSYGRRHTIILDECRCGDTLVKRLEIV